MKKLYPVIICFFLLLFVIPGKGWSYSWLYVFNPHTWGNSGQGTIDEALITIEPKGIYAEYNVYLSFSAMGLNMHAEDTLEITYYFSLPKNSIMHDSWLWVNDTARQARHIDRWTAWMVYESIVGYRRDPSVLFKDWQDNYSLRIYPLMGTGQRKVRISFMAPANWTSRMVSYPIPLDLLTPSLIPTGSIRILVKQDDKWINPRFTGYPELHLRPSDDEDFQGYIETSLPASYVNKQMDLSYNSPMKNGIYINRFPSAVDEGYYQMAFLPSEVFKISNKRKILALFDFELMNNYQTNESMVYQSFRSCIYNNLNDGDNLNIFLSAPEQPVKAANKWIPADSASLMETFSKLGSNPVQNYSNLEVLLKSAIKFIHENGNDGEILLFSNSNKYGDNQKANELMKKLNLLGPLPKITVIDFYELWADWYFIAGKYFNGNEYFYTMLTRQSSGNYYKYNYWENSVNDEVDQAISGLNNYLGSFDLHTRLSSGYCYGRYDLNDQAQNVNLGKPILQIGKYKGTGDIQVEAAGEFNGNSIYSTAEFSDSDIADSLLKKSWAGCYIADLEDDWSWDNQHVQKIISASLENRVLSNYTAFLALEPGQEYLLDDPGSENNLGSNAGVSGETVFTDDASARTNATIIGKSQVALLDIPYKVFPNPFYNHLHVQLAIPSSINWKTVIVEVFNQTGQRVRMFGTGELIFNGFLNVEWDGKNSEGTALGSGIYFMVIRNEQFKKDIKLVKL